MTDLSNQPEFVQEMYDINEEINRTESSIYNFMIHRDELEVKISDIEFKIMEEITNELDEKQKPIYSNADKRNAELKVRLSSDELYHAYKSELVSLKKVISESNQKVGYLVRKFRMFDLIGKLSCKNI